MLREAVTTAGDLAEMSGAITQKGRRMEKLPTWESSGTGNSGKQLCKVFIKKTNINFQSQFT